MKSPFIEWTPARRFGAGCLIALTVVIVLWHAWLAPPSKLPAWFSIALHTSVLWPALLLLALRRQAALFAGALACLLLFALGVMETWASPATRSFALLQSLLCLGVVAGASLDGLRARFDKNRGV